MKHQQKIIAATACFLSLSLLAATFIPARAFPNTDENIQTVWSFSKSQKPNEKLTFSPDDFTSRVKGTAKLKGIIIAGLPDSEQGKLLIGDEIADIGETIELEQLDTLCFTASGMSAETTLEFIPIFEKTGAADAPVSIKLNVSEQENSVPIALDKQFETYTNLTVCGALSHLDLENEPCTYTITSYPGYGDVIIDKSNFSYTPTGKSCKDSFAYTATDVHGNVSKAATVKINVAKRPANSNLTYSDMTNSHAHYAAIKLAESGILRGESFGASSFLSPQKPVTRAEFTALAATIAELSTPTIAISSGMSDNAAIPAWAQPYIASALNTGVVTGEKGSDGNHCFRPGDSITRAEAAVIISRISGALPGTQPVFSDFGSIPPWAEQAINSAASAGIIEAFPDGSFRPCDIVTREDAVEMLYSAQSYINRHEKSGFFDIFR